MKTLIKMDTSEKYKIITLNTGVECIVDEDMFDILSMWNWYENKGKSLSYASRVFWSPFFKKKVNIQMHRIVLGITDKNLFCDHINKNTLDNRRINLRVATRAQNMSYRKAKNGAHSDYLGVQKCKKRWKAEICHNGKQIYLGTYDTQRDAALAYNRKAIELKGEFASINIINRLSCL